MLGLLTNTELIRVEPVIRYRVRGLCVSAYEGHPKGCPNFNNPSQAHRCPPTAPLFDKYFNLTRPVYVVVNEFDLAAHMDRLSRTKRADGKEWTDAQLRCVLYWQAGARKQLEQKVQDALTALPEGYEQTWCPEGMGVDVTATLAKIGIELEWPVRKIARQVALIARRNDV